MTLIEIILCMLLASSIIVNFLWERIVKKQDNLLERLIVLLEELEEQGDDE